MKQNTDYSILDEDFNIQELLYTLKSLKIRLQDKIIYQMKL